MGACASRPSDDGASTSGSSKKSKAGKPGSDASTNPARVLNLGADAESYFARSGGRAFYASPPVSATDSVPRASLPRAAVEQAVTFESADGTHLAGVVHRPYDDDAGAMGHMFDVSRSPEDRALEGAETRDAKRRSLGNADAFDDVRTVPSPSSRHAGTRFRKRNPRLGRNEIGRCRDGDSSDGQSPSARGAGVALCHPHPFLGGDKDSALVVALARRLARAGVAVLRFDSRGVGGSGGTRTWMRDAEREDCEAATRFVSRLRGVDKKRVYAVGYGLGAAVALEASKRERSARGFVGISYPFGAKSMLVPCAVGEKAIRVRGNGGIGDAFPKKPRLFAVAGRDCVGSAGDCDAVAASARKLPPPRRVVVVDDADHAWCGFYETLAEHVVEFMEEHAAALSAESSSSEGSSEASDEPSADGGRPATGRDVASSSSISKSSSLDEFPSLDARMSENEDTDDSGDGSPFGGSSFGGSRRTRRDAASHGAPTSTAAAPLSDEARYAGGWMAETLTEVSEVSDLRVEAPGWEREVRARARAAATAGGRPLGPLAGRGAREKPRAGDEPPPRVSSSSSPLRSRRRNQNFPDAPSSDDGQSSVGAYGDASGGFETWEAWEEEKRRRAKMGSPGHTPAASRGSTPWQTPGHSPRRSPLGPRSVRDFDGEPLDEPLDERIVNDFAEPADPWALNGAPPLIRTPEDVAAEAAAKLAALRADEFETKSDASGSLSDVSAPAASRASNRRVPTPMPVSTVETHEAIDGGSSKGRHSRTGSRDGLAAQFPPRNDSPRFGKGTPPLGSPSGSRPGSTVGSAREPARPILKKTSSYVNLDASGGSANSREGSQHGPREPRDPNEPSLLTAFANASTKLHGRPNMFRSGIRAVLAANRFVAAGQKRVQWEETTAEGRPIIDAVHRKPTRVGNRMRSATKAIMAGNRLSTFGTGGAAAPGPLRGQFQQKSVVEEREWARHNKIADVRRRVSERSPSERSSRTNAQYTEQSTLEGNSRGSSELSRRGARAEARLNKPRFSAAARAVVAGYRVRQFGAAGLSGEGAGAGAGARGSERSSSRSSRSRSPSLGSRSPSVSRSGSPSRRRARAGGDGGDGGDDAIPGGVSERLARSGPGSPSGPGRRLITHTGGPAPRGSPSSSLRASRGEPGGSRSRSRSGF